MLVGLVCFVVYRFVMIGGLFGSALDPCSWWLLSWLGGLTAGGLCYFCFCLVFSVWRVVLFGWFLLVVWLGVWFDGGGVIVRCCGCVAASLVLSGCYFGCVTWLIVLLWLILLSLLGGSCCLSVLG